MGANKEWHAGSIAVGTLLTYVVQNALLRGDREALAVAVTAAASSSTSSRSSSAQWRRLQQSKDSYSSSVTEAQRFTWWDSQWRHGMSFVRCCIYLLRKLRDFEVSGFCRQLDVWITSLAQRVWTSSCWQPVSSIRLTRCDSVVNDLRNDARSLRNCRQKLWWVYALNASIDVTV